MTYNFFRNLQRSLLPAVRKSSKSKRGTYRRKLSLETLESRQLLAATPLANLTVSENTGEKPQSKVFEYAGQWWTVMPNKTGTWVFRLDGTSWTPTQQIATSNSTFADVKVVGDLAHVLLYDGTKTQLASLQYDVVDNRFEAWSLRPQLVNVGLASGTETATLDVDSTGRMWIAYDPGSQVVVKYSDGNYSSWSAPIVVESGIKSDDIATIIAMPGNKIGVMWSNQNTKRFGFKIHEDGAAPTAWSSLETPAMQWVTSVGGNFADDHVNMAVTSDGTLYAAVKTGYDSSSRPEIMLLVRRPNGVWDNAYTVDSKGTRPIVVVNEAAGKLIVAYSPSDSGGDTVYKESPLGTISFGAKKVLISGKNNNVTSAKSVSSNEIVFLAGTSSTVRGVRFTFDVVAPPPINLPPGVNAGPDRVAVAGTAILLDATVTDDGRPTPTVATAWSKISGPGTVTFGNANLVDTTVTFSAAGTYTLRLTANDGQYSVYDEIVVIVSAPAVVNTPPTVNAGTDRVAVAGTAISLDATVTDDGLPGPFTSVWSKISGPGTVTFGNVAAVDTTVTFSAAGTYTLRLTANDGQYSIFDEILVIVSAPAIVNTPPVVNAGSDRNTVVGTAVSLDGTVTDDGRPGPFTSVWSKISGPGTVTFGNASAIDTTASFSSAGTYVLRLTANDGQYTTYDEVTVIVSTPAPVPQTPSEIAFQNGLYPSVSYAGMTDTKISSSNKTKNYGNEKTIDIDGDPDIAALLRWDVSTIPADSIVTSVYIDFYVSNSTKQDFEVFTLNRPWDEMSATWNNAMANTPWSTAGATGAADRNGTILGQFAPAKTGIQRLTLNAAGIAAVQAWINDPSSNFGIILQDYAASDGIDIATSENSTVSRRPKLVINYQPAALGDGGDNEVEVDEDENDAPPPVVVNNPPVVNAGTDRFTQVGTPVLLEGTVSDDGQPTGQLVVQWSKVSGPGTVTFANAGAANTTVDFSAAGTYTLRLMASDGAESTADEVIVSVTNPVAPIIDTPPPAVAIPTEVSFQDGATYAGTSDTKIASSKPTTNYGNATSFDVDTNIAALLRWDISAIPTTSIVVSAAIELYVTNTTKDTYELYAMQRAWDELSATWQQYATGQAWSAVGATGSADMDRAVLGQVSPGSKGFYRIELNEAGVMAVQAWINDPESNFGFIIEDYAAKDGFDFYSSEYSTAARRPKLIINYHTPT